MKKYLIILLTLLLIGCKNNIITETKQTENYTYTITYPKTPYKKLNKEIKKYIKKQKNKKYNELNIDYKQNIIDNYITIELITTIDTLKETKTFVYEKNKKLNIYDILTENDIKILNNIIKKNLKNINFTFDENNLYIENTTIPLEKFDLKININKQETKKYTYKEIKKQLNTNKKRIALTFDDGPSKYTKKIIDLLNEYNANATFFILGNKVKTYKETLKYMLESGNEIGNHTYNHKLLTNQTEQEIEYQINETQKIIKETLDYTPKLFRPSYGSINKNVKKTNLEITLWNIDSLDWKYKNKTKILNHILPKIENNKIILFHDTQKYTYDTLKELLPKLKDYQIITVSELKQLNEK